MQAYSKQEQEQEKEQAAGPVTGEAAPSVEGADTAAGPRPGTDTATETADPVQEQAPPCKTRRGWLLSLLLVALLSSFPVLFLYLNNAGEVAFKEAAGPLGLYLAAGMLVFVVAAALTRNSAKAALIAGVWMLLLSNYTLLEKAVHRLTLSLHYWQIMPIVVVLALHLSWLLGKKMPEQGAGNLVKVLCIGFSALLVFNLVTAAPALSRKMKADIRQAEFEPTAADAVGRPNLYYFIFDEYSNFDIIQKFYGYDNLPFARELEEKGFTVSYTSRNEFDSTTVILGNLFSLEYRVTPEHTTAERVQLRRSGAFLPLLESKGYEVVALGSAPSVLGVGDEAQIETGAATIEGESFLTLLLKNTPYYPFVDNTAAKSRFQQRITNSIRYFENSENLRPKQGTATICYLSFPHQPFVYTEDGKDTNAVNWNNWSDPQYYLGQFIYSTKVMRDMIDQILKNDPDSVILLQSDHSARALVDADGGKPILREDRTHILNAAYYRGEPFPAIDGASGLNSLRAVLAELLEVSLPPVEVPQYED